MTQQKDFQNKSKLKDLIFIKETKKITNKIKDFNENIMNYEQEVKKQKYNEIQKDIENLNYYL